MSAVGESTVKASPVGSMPAVEWQTFLLVLVNYAGWLAVTFAYSQWSLWITAPLAVVLVTLHSSLQHEILHGHPTRWPAVNQLLAIVPLSLWLPYKRYVQLHLTHHHDERLTDALDDPETYYWTAEDWRKLNPVSRLLLHIQQTLAGRVLLGSFWRIGMFMRHEMDAIRANCDRERAIWFEHLLWCVPVVAWITLVCHMPLWIYVLAIVVPARGMVLIRAFAEHRAQPSVRERVAIVEKSRILGPLFLYNNLHSLHHEKPGIPWYQYNRRYRRERARLIAENGGLVYVTYFDVARRYLFWPHDVLLHPADLAPKPWKSRTTERPVEPAEPRAVA